MGGFVSRCASRTGVTSLSSCATTRAAPASCSRPPTPPGRHTTATADTAPTDASIRTTRAYKASYILDVVETIARSNGETIQVHGAEAVRRCRLSTQVPTAPVFHTSASSRTIRIGSITVRMVHTSNRRRLQFAGKPTSVALSALWYLGKNNVTPETVATIAATLGPAEFETLRSADMPAWMAKALADAARETVHG